MAVLTRRITRDKLAAVFKTHELIKAFENLTEDTIQIGTSLPSEIEALRGLLQDEALGSGAARVDAMAALAISVAVQSLADALATAPIPQPAFQNADAIDLLSAEPPASPIAATSCECDTAAQLQAIREEVALLRSQIQALQLAPN